MNLFINSNAQELLKEMKPALKDKFTVLLRNFMDNLFSRVPFDEWVEWVKHLLFVPMQKLHLFIYFLYKFRGIKKFLHFTKVTLRIGFWLVGRS